MVEDTRWDPQPGIGIASPDYPEISEWSGPGVVTELKVEAGHVGYLVTKGLSELSFLHTGGPETDRRAAPWVVVTLRRLNKEHRSTADAITYICSHMLHTPLQPVNLSAFHESWTKQNG